VKWLADENFRNAILRGLLRQAPRWDMVRAQDLAETAGQDDLGLLRFATAEGRVVVTQDLSTMLPAREEQLRLMGKCAPVVFVPDWLPVQSAIQDLLLLDACGTESDWSAGVLYLPLR
jgi:hypothetical protein